MNIRMSLVSGFEDLYNKYIDSAEGLKLLAIEGIAPNDLDVGMANYDFFEKKLSDISSDANANWAEDISPTIYRTYTTNGQMKLLGYHTLWYHAMKRFGKEFADKAISMIWDGDLYFHDAHGLRIQMPYCYAFSLDKIVLEGRPYGPSRNTPPKNRKSFLSQVDKLIGDLSKQFAGATAPSDFFLWYGYFCKKDGLDPSNKDHRKLILQDMQGMVCLFNDASRAEGEPPFTNISIYDSIGLESLFGHILYPDFSKPDLEYVMDLQKIFCEWFSNGDPITGFPYRFPVVTQNLTTDDNGNFIDKDHAKWVAQVNTKMANFNLHFGKKNKLAMCPMHKDTEVFTENGWVKISQIDRALKVATVNMDTQQIEWNKPTDYQQVYTENIDEYKTNWHTISCDPHHPLMTASHEVKLSKDIMVKDKLMVAKDTYSGNTDLFAELIGFYIGDGYLDGNAIMFGFKKDRKIKYLERLLDDLEIGYTKSNADLQGIIRFRFHDDILLKIAQDIGKAKDKYIPKDIMTCGDMTIIAGIYNGLMSSDGSYRKDGSRPQFITTSDKLKDDFCAIALMMGYTTNEILDIDHEFIINGKQYICDRCWYISVRNDKWKNMASNKVSKEYNDYTYCLTVENSIILYRFDGKTFIQHQCRYENDLEDMEMTPDSFGNGGVNIGSHRVVTPNYAKAALLAHGDERVFYDVLNEYFEVSAKLLLVHREDILQKRIDKTPQYLKFFGNLGWFNLNTMFSTFGVVGIYEAVKFMGYDIVEDDGTNFALDLMSYINNQVKYYRSETGYAFNAEEIPGEQACVTMLKKDKITIKLSQMTNEVCYDLINTHLYSNQYIPLTNQADIITRLDLSGRFMKRISGGGIVHANVEAPIDTAGKMYEIMKLACRSGVPHLAVCYRFGRCANHEASVVGQDIKNCPICGDPLVHIRARVIGYFSDEYNWSPVRQKHDAPNRHYSKPDQIEAI